MFWKHEDWQTLEPADIGSVLAMLASGLPELRDHLFLPQEDAARHGGSMRALPVRGIRVRRLGFYTDQWLYELDVALTAEESGRFASARAYLMVGPTSVLHWQRTGAALHQRESVMRQEEKVSAHLVDWDWGAGENSLHGFNEYAGLDLRGPGGATKFDPALLVDYVDFYLSFCGGNRMLLRGGSLGRPDGDGFRIEKLTPLQSSVGGLLDGPGSHPAAERRAATGTDDANAPIRDAEVFQEDNGEDADATAWVSAVTLHGGILERTRIHVRETSNPVASVDVVVMDSSPIRAAPADMLQPGVDALRGDGARLLLVRHPRRQVAAGEFLRMLAHAAEQPVDAPLAHVEGLHVSGAVHLRQQPILGPIRVRDVEFAGDVSLDGFRSDFGAEFVGCNFLGGFHGASCRLAGDLVLRDSRFLATSDLDLFDARIDGDAIFSGASIGGRLDVSHGRIARNLVCLHAEIRGGVHAHKLHCGDVVLALARAGAMTGEGGDRSRGESLELMQASIGRLQLNGASLAGDVSVQDADVKTGLFCVPEQVGEMVFACEVSGSLLLSGARIGMAVFDGMRCDRDNAGIIMIGGTLSEFIIDVRKAGAAVSAGTRTGFILMDGVTGLRKVKLAHPDILLKDLTLRRIECAETVEIDSTGMKRLDLGSSQIRELVLSDPVPELNLSGVRVERWRLGRGGEDANATDSTGQAIAILRKMNPLDRSVWLKLEADLRNEGQFDEADRIFLAMKKEERSPQRNLLSPLQRCSSWLMWLIFGHGVRIWTPIALVCLSSLLLVAVLSVPANVKLSEGGLLQLGGQCGRIASTAAAAPAKCKVWERALAGDDQPALELTAGQFEDAGIARVYGRGDAFMLGLRYMAPLIGFDDSDWAPVEGAKARLDGIPLLAGRALPLSPAMLAAAILVLNTILLAFAAGFITRRWLR